MSDDCLIDRHILHSCCPRNVDKLTKEMIGKKLAETLRPSVRNSNFPSNHEVPQVLQPATKPVILIIHGAYVTPELWQPFIKALTEAGFEAHCPRLPTCGDKDILTGTFADARPAKATYDDDVKAVRKRAIEVAAAERSIVVLAHSYGGIVAADAIDAELCTYSRPPGTGGVAQLILLSTWLPLKGQSLDDMLMLEGNKSSCDVRFNEDGTAVLKNAAEAFFNDIKPVIRAEELAATTVTHNWSAGRHKIVSTPWMMVPTTYIHCSYDKAIWPELQEAMVKNAVLEGETKALRTKTLDAGHCPFLSTPDVLMSIVENIALGV